ncbi:MAG: hypothetical protein NUV69_03860 [Candidatus Curtissbacteria bacterium]|nr:hypothetical protein [Candidatus Curtissbacteria bacterium]
MASERAEQSQVNAYLQAVSGEPPMPSCVLSPHLLHKDVARFVYELRLFPVIEHDEEERQQYIQGIIDFAHANDIKPHDFGIPLPIGRHGEDYDEEFEERFALEEMLNDPSFFTGLTEGINWNCINGRANIARANEESKIPLMTNGLDDEALNEVWKFRMGYKFGFNVGSVRSFGPGFTLPARRTPSDYDTYHAFMAGLRGRRRWFSEEDSPLEKCHSAGIVLNAIVPEDKLAKAIGNLDRLVNS